MSAAHQTYLIFEHRSARYGLNVRSVREMLWLPALSPVEELPPWIAGIFNLRGQVVPVIDLCLRFGHARAPYRLGDRIIVLNGDGGQPVGVIANQLHQVIALPAAAINPATDYQIGGAAARFVFGEAQLDDGLAMLLDAQALVDSTPSPDALAPDLPDLPESPAEQLLRLYGELDTEQLERLRERTRGLAQVPEIRDQAEHRPFAVLRLEGERFGLGLELVHEFTHLRSYAPVPCCPPHIVGNMNLRGDILTLVDLRPVLGLTSEMLPKKVVVVRVGALRFGLLVSAVDDIVHLGPADITALPLALEHAGQAFCKGCATLGDQSLGLLDLDNMLTTRRLQVAQQPASSRQSAAPS